MPDSLLSGAWILSVEGSAPPLDGSVAIPSRRFIRSTHVFRTFRPYPADIYRWASSCPVISIGRTIGSTNRALGPDALLIHCSACDAVRCGAMRIGVSWLMLLLRPVCGSTGAQPFLHAVAACTFLVQRCWSGAEPTLMSWTVWLRDKGFSQH